MKVSIPAVELLSSSINKRGSWGGVSVGLSFVHDGDCPAMYTAMMRLKIFPGETGNLFIPKGISSAARKETSSSRWGCRWVDWGRPTMDKSSGIN